MEIKSRPCSDCGTPMAISISFWQKTENPFTVIRAKCPNCGKTEVHQIPMIKQDNCTGCRWATEDTAKCRRCKRNPKLRDCYSL